MSGSLDRLVLRAQGRLPVAEPLLPSRYATGSPAGLAEEIGAEPVAQSVASHREPPAPTIPPTLSRTPAPTPTPMSVPRVEPRPPPIGAQHEVAAEASSPSPTVAGPATISLASPVSIAAERSSDEPPGRPARPPPTAAEPARAPPPEPLSRPNAPPPPAPQTARAEPAPPDPDRRPSPGVSPFLARAARLAATRAGAIEAHRAAPLAPPPDVHISIGRLEVHAAPARQAPARAAPARQPALSLADYLAHRK